MLTHRKVHKIFVICSYPRKRDTEMHKIIPNFVQVDQEDINPLFI